MGVKSCIIWLKHIWHYMLIVSIELGKKWQAYTKRFLGKPEVGLGKVDFVMPFVTSLFWNNHCDLIFPNLEKNELYFDLLLF